MTETKDNNSRNLWIAVVLMFILAFTVGYVVKTQLHPKPITETSNGFLFTKQGNFWTTVIKNKAINREYNLEFRYSPSQVKNVTVQGDPTNFFTLLKLNNLTAAYFTFNPNENLSFLNLVAADSAHLLNSLNGVTLVAGCTVNQTSACADRPIITCENQLDKALVIYAKPGPVPKVTMQKNCLIIEGQGEDIIRASTKLYFMWYGII